MDAPLLPDEIEDPTPSRVWDSHMENPNPPPSEEPSFVWDWGNLLDFSIDDPSSIISWDSDDRLDNPGPSIAPPEEGSESVPPVPVSDRVRKRDPRLSCENFLAGRVPCACPELDEKEEKEREEEEEEEGIGRKRARIGSKSVVRCQVPACEADITALKGYHRRHRVCLRCANASLVVLDGQHKRYCQQCGKFHLLPDFDEGKRSCRRKLERHNNRRRRKSAGSQNAVEKESPENLLVDDVGCDGEIAKEMLNGVSSASDSLSLSNHLRDTEALLENEDQHGSPSCLLSSFENTQSNNNTSFTVSNKTQREPATINSKTDFSSTFRGNKSTYSSVCPTGRISFKLYDWNPAEFPRRLRHQIFQWLASMPVELEGYIRPGCTILTLFIAMPRFMWEKLSEDGASYLRGLVDSPESLFSRRGAMFIHLNNTMFQVLRDGTSLMSIKLEVRVPKIHHVHPNFFEAGKPIVFVACGSNLSQPNFRFLISFAGKYLVYDSCLAIPQRKISICSETKEDSADGSDHEMFKICIPHTEENIFGPAFIEVENESGLSNFIPVLFGDGAICAELQILQQGFDESLCSSCCETKFLDCPDLSPDSCKLLDWRHTKMSELLLDIAWLLKDFELDKIPTHLTVIQIKRLNYLLNFLIVKESAVLLERILLSLKSAMDAKELSNAADGICVAEMSLLRKNMDQARQILNRREKDDGNVLAHTENIAAQVALSPLSGVESEVLYTKPYFCQDAGARKEDILKPGQMTASPRTDKADPVVNKVVIMNLNDCPRLLMGFGGWPRRTYSQFFSGTIMRTRLLVFLVVTLVTCFGICAVLSHPHKVGEFAVTIRRCLFFDLEP